jgi:hypothetical protein
MAFTGTNAPNGGLGGSPFKNSSKAWYGAGNGSSTSRTSLRQEAPAVAQRGRQRSGFYWPSWVLSSYLPYSASRTFGIPSWPDYVLLARAAHMSCSLRADKLEHACQYGEQKVLLSPEALPAFTTNIRECHKILARTHWTCALHHMWLACAVDAVRDVRTAPCDCSILLGHTGRTWRRYGSVGVQLFKSNLPSSLWIISSMRQGCRHERICLLQYAYSLIGTCR